MYSSLPLPPRGAYGALLGALALGHPGVPWCCRGPALQRCWCCCSLALHTLAVGGQAPREATAPSPTTVPSSLPLPFGCNFWFAMREPNGTPAQSLSTRQQLCYNFSPKAALALLQSSLINFSACEHVPTPSVQPGVEQCHLEVRARGL